MDKQKNIGEKPVINRARRRAMDRVTHKQSKPVSRELVARKKKYRRWRRKRGLEITEWNYLSGAIPK